MNKVENIGISSNVLKIIAVILMLIDHIAEYMYPYISPGIYYLFRSLGRMAMPIFVYMLVQGFFYTKNLKKYIFRIFVLALITQLLIFILGFINQEYYERYKIGINGYFTVVFSYALSLIFIAIIDKTNIVMKFNNKINLFIRINILIVILLVYLNLKIEFGIQVLFLFLGIYLLEKKFSNMSNELLLKRKFERKIDYIKKKIVYLIIILFAIIISTCFVDYDIGWKYTILFSIIPIALYNGNRGKNNSVIKYSFYYIFPVHHCILYILAMIMYNQ